MVVSRRARVLSKWFAELLGPGAHVLDVGCGDGQVAAQVQHLRPDVTVQGVDVLRRERPAIPVEIFDGCHLPFGDAALDVVLLSDVLHHAADPLVLLREARRVGSQAVLIKDHYRKGFGAGWRLRFMDWVGNARFGVALPYNYWSESEWQAAWRKVGLRPQQVRTRLGLYPGPADWVFGAKLHFIALLQKCDPLV